MLKTTLPKAAASLHEARQSFSHDQGKSITPDDSSGALEHISALKVVELAHKGARCASRHIFLKKTLSSLETSKWGV